MFCSSIFKSAGFQCTGQEQKEMTQKVVGISVFEGVVSSKGRMKMQDFVNVTALEGIMQLMQEHVVAPKMKWIFAES